MHRDKLILMLFLRYDQWSIDPSCAAAAMSGLNTTTGFLENVEAMKKNIFTL